MEGERPDRPQEPDLNDLVWDMTKRCWQEDPVLRPRMERVVATLDEGQVSLSLYVQRGNFYFLQSRDACFSCAAINNLGVIHSLWFLWFGVCPSHLHPPHSLKIRC